MSLVVQDAPKTELVATHVDELTRAELLARAREEDRSLSAIVRRAIHAYLERDGNDEGGTT